MKGRVKKRWLFWEQLDANKSTVNIIREGYKLNFEGIPIEKCFKNNQSALNNVEFVNETLRELLNSGAIIEVPFQPTVVSPLSVNTRPSGKKRLILDLRYVNKHLVKEHIEFSDWRVFSQFIRSDGFVFNFDLKKGYYHVDIFPDHQMFLGFSWKIENKEKFFIFTVLQFGLSSAPALFTRLLRPLISVWHKQGINISVYLDDGACIAYSYNKTVEHSYKVKKLLTDSGFVINEEKSNWKPSRSMTWLGIIVNLEENTYKITSERVLSLLSSINFILKTPYTTARQLSRIAGKIVSTKFVLGNIIRLKTRFIYKVIDNQNSWDSHLNILNYPEAHKDILFWRDNINDLNKRNIIENTFSSITIFSNASSTGIGAICESNNLVCHKNFNLEERNKSSTWRELEAVRIIQKTMC